MPNKAENPFKKGYDTKLDSSRELDPDAASYYLNIMNVLRWMIELGRIDIITKVSLLSSHVALPTEGHFNELIHVVAHVGQRYYSRLVYDLSYRKIDHNVFHKGD